MIITGAQPKAGTGHKMQSISVVFSTLHCEGYIADLIYRWLITSGSARWLILKFYLPLTRHFEIRKNIAFWGQPLRCIEKLIENKSDLPKLSTLSKPFIVKFIENQSEHLSKVTLYHLKKRATRSRRAREPSRIPLLFLRGSTRRIAC